MIAQIPQHILINDAHLILMDQFCNVIRTVPLLLRNSQTLVKYWKDITALHLKSILNV